jgi:hypothetical protein
MAPGNSGGPAYYAGKSMGILSAASQANSYTTFSRAYRIADLLSVTICHSATC